MTTRRYSDYDKTVAKLDDYVARREQETEDPSFASFVSFAAWPELDPAALHGLPGDFVRMVEPHSEADPAALLIQYLVAVGCAIGREPHTVVEADRHSTNLYVVVVGDTAAGRKGTSWGHVRRTIAEADPDLRIRGGLSSGEGLVYELRDPTEQDDDEDDGVADKRLLVIESEYGSVLKVATRPGNTLTTVLRDAWDSVTLSTMTKNSPLTATDPHVAVIGHITRDELLRLLTETDSASGFGNRFTWVCTKRSKLLPRGGEVPRAKRAAHVIRLRRALTVARDIGKVERTEEAWQEWEQVYEALTTGRGGLMGAMVARGAAHVLRLSTLYALLDGSREIRPEHQRAALAVWQYAEDSAGWIFGGKLGDPDADAILGALRRAGKVGLTRTQISSSIFSRRRDKAGIDRALGVLESASLATCTREETAGRPAERWRIAT